MIKRFSFVLALLFLIPMSVYAQDNSAKSAIVIDKDTLTVLYEKNADESLSMASTTKIMTALLVIESNRLDETVTVTKEMTDIVGTSLYLNVGDTISLYDCVVGMLLASGNDAANAGAIFTYKSMELFIDAMNKKATEIGMTNTLFVTPSGLDEGNHHSTSRDMAILTAYALNNDVFSSICSMGSATITVSGKVQTIYNHNKLLFSEKNCIGVKTGYTDKAGRCLVTAFKYGTNTLICVTLCDGNDWADHKSLIKACKKKYKKIEETQTISIPCVGGEKETVTASYSYKVITLLDTINKNEYYYPFVYAPIKSGDTLGYAVINNEKVPIMANEDLKIYGFEE